MYNVWLAKKVFVLEKECLFRFAERSPKPSCNVLMLKITCRHRSGKFLYGVLKHLGVRDPLQGENIAGDPLIFITVIKPS